jgi:hypothetical protein
MNTLSWQNIDKETAEKVSEWKTLTQIKEIEDKLEDALARREWSEIWRFEDELKELKDSPEASDYDRSRIMSDSQKLRYAWLVQADRTRLKDTAEVISILDHVASILKTLPNDKDKMKSLIGAVLLKAKKEGCTVQEVASLQPFLNELVRAELRSRK